MCYGLVELVRSQLACARPLISLIISITFLLGWTIQFSFWANCDLREFSDGTQLEFCKKWPSLEKGTSSVQYARFSLGLLSVVGFVAIVVFSTLAVYRARKDTARELKLNKENVGS